ncbi:MAG TPA: DUF423 domain-containing protein [Stellaceae bacterium]|nr:DUF423 domain-containing protein [Stellaceae bacterium]
MIRLWLAVAAFGGLCSVAAGAAAAHLSGDAKASDLLRTGALYGMVHAAALVAVVALASRRLSVRVAGWSLAAGIVLFSFSLYALAFGGPVWLADVTPFGGFALMLGWASLAVAALRRRN